MRLRLALFALPAAVALLPAALPALAPDETAMSAQASAGYLAPGQIDILAILPPAPVRGDARYEADRRTFRRTRRLEGTPRWALATADVPSSARAVLRDFSCAAGVTLTPVSAPATYRLVARAGADTARQTNIAKDFYKRRRPFWQDKGPVCQPRADLADSFDYPSGHTTRGWTQAQILAELMPDRATALLARGRAYGESRIVCGAHNQSAVEAGYLSASTTLAVVRTSAAYQADLAAARSELAQLRTHPDTPRPAQCDLEARLVAERVL